MLLCDDPHNIYAPCESDNSGAVVAHHVSQNSWNNCELGEFTISGEITRGGVCHCVCTVGDGDGGADTYNGGDGTDPIYEGDLELGCEDNASACTLAIYRGTFFTYRVVGVWVLLGTVCPTCVVGFCLQFFSFYYFKFDFHWNRSLQKISSHLKIPT